MAKARPRPRPRHSHESSRNLRARRDLEPAEEIDEDEFDKADAANEKEAEKNNTHIGPAAAFAQSETSAEDEAADAEDEELFLEDRVQRVAREEVARRALAARQAHAHAEAQVHSQLSISLVTWLVAAACGAVACIFPLVLLEKFRRRKDPDPDVGSGDMLKTPRWRRKAKINVSVGPTLEHSSEEAHSGLNASLNAALILQRAFRRYQGQELT